MNHLDCPECMRRRAERERRRQAELKSLAFELAASAITNETVVKRRKIVQGEAPRFEPEKAFAKHVGDVG